MRTLFALCLVFLSMSISAAEIELSSRSNPPLTEYGATHLRFEGDGVSFEAVVLRDLSPLAFLNVTWVEDGLRAEWSPVGGEPFVLESSAEGFALELADGRRVVRQPRRPGGPAIVINSFDEAEFAARTFEIQLIGDTLASIEDRVRLNSVIRRPAAPKSDCIRNCGPGEGGSGEVIVAPPSDDTGSQYRVVCAGPKYWGEAYSVALRRSTLCDQAKAAANAKCMNADCTGCCAFSDCNAYCQAGDYFCQVASIEGTSCSRAR